MISKKILSVCVSFIIILFVTATVGCGSSSSSKCDFNRAKVDGINKFNRVVAIYNGASVPTPLGGVTVEALDNVNGTQLLDAKLKPITQVSDADGKVCFDIDTKYGEKVAFKNNGFAVNDTTHYIDVITSNCLPDDVDPTLYMIEFQNVFLMSMFLVDNLGNYHNDGGLKCVLAGQLMWKDPSGNPYPVGCAKITFEDAATHDPQITRTDYDDDSGYASPTQEYTYPGNAKFSAISIPAGMTTIRAWDKDDPTKELTDPDHPNTLTMVKSNDASDSTANAVFPTNPRPVINLSTIWVKQSATNPTQAGCQ